LQPKVAEMLRAVVVLSVLLLGAASNDQRRLKGTDTYADCALSSVGVVDELLDSSIFIWAAVKRCGDDKDPYRCEIDVSSAVGSVTKAMTIMVRALSECGALNNTKCGEAAGHLTASLADITAASTQIVVSCPAAPLRPPQTKRLLTSAQMPALRLAQCVVDVKDSMRSIFRATTAFMTVKEQCKEGGPECAQNVLKIVAAFSGMGSYLTGAVGHCSAGALTHGEECGKGVAMLIKHLSIVADAGIVISHECSSHGRRRRRRKSSSDVGGVGNSSLTNRSPRLWFREEDEEDAWVKDDWEEGSKEEGVESLGSKMNIALVTLLPITAFVSFAIGCHARHHSYEVLPEVDVA